MQVQTIALSAHRTRAHFSHGGWRLLFNELEEVRLVRPYNACALPEPGEIYRD